MPTYVYACTNPDCGHQFEAVQAFTDDALTVCPVCGQRLRKVFGSVGVVFKGSGFYRNDSREKVTNGSAKGGSSGDKNAASTDSAAGSGSGSTESGGTTAGKSESSSAAPASGKSEGSSTSSSPAKSGTNGSTVGKGSSKAKQAS